MTRPKLTVPLILTIALVAACSLLAGCNEDERLAKMATEAANRQAAQNEEMARLNREIADGSKRLVAASADATDKVLTAGHTLDEQRSQIDTQRQALAQERDRDSILGPVITTLGTLLVCALPLVLCWHLLHGLRHGDEVTEINQLLVEEIVSDEPILLPPPRQYSEHRSLPAHDASPDPRPE